MRGLFLLVFIAFFLAACVKRKEKEPNDHFTNATPIKPGATIKGTMRSPGDIDVYKLNIKKKEGVLSLHVGGIQDMDFVLSFQDKDRQELKKYDETGLGGDEKALDLGIQKGFYYVALSNKNSKADNPNQIYQLEVRIESGQGNEREPNDVAFYANPLELEGVFRGHYFPTYNPLAEEDREEDWFRIDVDTGQHLLNLDLAEVPQVDPILEIYDTNFYKLKEIDSGGIGEGEVLKGFGVKGPVQYYLRLRSKKKFIGNSEVPYEILTELLPYRGQIEFEANDHRLEATAFNQESIQGSIHPKGDVDWYKISIDANAKLILTANIEGLPGMDLEMKFCDVLGHPLIHVDNHRRGKPEFLTGVGVAGGHYYLVVLEKTGKKSDARQSYTLSQKLIPYQEGLEYEVNDSSASAQPLEVGKILNGYLAPEGDVDWYEFNVYSEGTAVFELTGLLNVHWIFSLYDQEYKEILTQSAEKIGQPLRLEKFLEAGTYAVRLRARHRKQNNVRDKYTLRIKVQ